MPRAQAIGLLDDLDKELNTYAMRVREWYGWHFPEMTKIVGDNIAYAKTVKLMGTRDKAAGIDFSGGWGGGGSGGWVGIDFSGGWARRAWVRYKHQGAGSRSGGGCNMAWVPHPVNGEKGAVLAASYTCRHLRGSSLVLGCRGRDPLPLPPAPAHRVPRGGSGEHTEGGGGGVHGHRDQRRRRYQHRGPLRPGNFGIVVSERVMCCGQRSG